MKETLKMVKEKKRREEKYREDLIKKEKEERNKLNFLSKNNNIKKNQFLKIFQLIYTIILAIRKKAQ